LNAQLFISAVVVVFGVLYFKKYVVALGLLVSSFGVKKEIPPNPKSSSLGVG